MNWNILRLGAALILALVFATSIYAQAGAKPANGKAAAGKAAGKGKPDKDAKKTEQGDPLDTSADLADPVAKQRVGWLPEFAALGTLALPIGDVATILDMGFGGRADFTTHIPAMKFLKQGGFDIRPGLLAGLQLHAVKSAKGGNFTAMPGLIYASIELTRVSPSLRPYFALGSGVTISSASATGIGSIDATLYGALGTKWFPGKEQKFFIKAEASFYMIFESVSGMFMHANIGGGYRI